MHLSSYIPSLLYWFSFFSFHSLKWNGMTLCRVWSTIVFCLIVTKLWVFFLKTIICQYLKITVTARVWAFLDKFCKKNWLKLTNSTPLKVFVLEPSTVSIIFFEPWFWVTKSVDTYHQLMLLLLLHLDCFINYWHLIGHRRSLSLKISPPRLDSFMILFKNLSPFYSVSSLWVRLATSRSPVNSWMLKLHNIHCLLLSSRYFISCL